MCKQMYQELFLCAVFVLIFVSVLLGSEEKQPLTGHGYIRAAPGSTSLTGKPSMYLNLLCLYVVSFAVSPFTIPLVVTHESLFLPLRSNIYYDYKVLLFTSTMSVKVIVILICVITVNPSIGLQFAMLHFKQNNIKS